MNSGVSSSSTLLSRLHHAFSADWRGIWFLLLLPVVLFLPAMPIDETRYLAVAWEMHLHGNYLVPHLNGAPYSDKPPLLFWLINIGWLFAGMNVWVVRFGILMASLVSLLLFRRLSVRLGASGTFARNATLLLLGMLYFALFSSAIMFDVILTTWVLVAMHGALDLDQRRWWRGIGMVGLAFGLGILTKGPVVLLDAGMVLLFAPWWSETARSQPGRWYGAMLLGVLIGAAIALAWAIPAAIAGGHKYADAIFLHQTVDRMSKSFAHRRPLWWYFMVMPLMVLPWTLAVRASWRTWWHSLNTTKLARFAVAWFVPTFVAFCLVSGKQPHYMLPLLPALALYLAEVLSHDDSRLRGRLFGMLLLSVATALAAMPYLAAHAHEIGWVDAFARREKISDTALTVLAGVWPWWGVLAMALGLWLLVRGRSFSTPRALALSCVAAASIGMLTLAQGIGPYVNVTAAAQRIKQTQESGTPIAHLAWHHGLFEFAGRLTQPLLKVNYADLHAWCEAHPNGIVVTFYTRYPITAKPFLTLPYRFHRILFWHASDLLASPLPGSKYDAGEDESDSD